MARRAERASGARESKAEILKQQVASSLAETYVPLFRYGHAKSASRFWKIAANAAKPFPKGPLLASHWKKAYSSIGGAYGCGIGAAGFAWADRCEEWSPIEVGFLTVHLRYLLLDSSFFIC